MQIAGPRFANPVVTALPADLNLQAFFDNGPLLADWYENHYQVRVYDSSGATGPGSQPRYWETNIVVDRIAGTWKVICPLLATPTTTINVNPSVPPAAGTEVVFDVTVDPAYPGWVQLSDYGEPQGDPVAVDANGRAFWNLAPAEGSHIYTAVFIPQGGLLVEGDRSGEIHYVVRTTPTLVGRAPSLIAGPYRPG